MSRLSKEDCIRCLREKAEELGRFPKKSDFDEETVGWIKAFFGPWPRALETAGIKEPNPERMEKKRAKRERARKNRRRYRREHSKEHLEPENSLERKEESK